MKLKIKRPLTVYFRFILMLLSFSLPFVFSNAAYDNMISEGHYFWFLYFIVIFLLMIYFLVKTNYYELINAKIYDEKLLYYNLLFLKREIKLKEIKGYKNGVDENSNEFFTIYDNRNRKIATLKESLYSNLAEFLEALNCERIGYENTAFHKIILRIKSFFNDYKTFKRRCCAFTN